MARAEGHVVKDDASKLRKAIKTKDRKKLKTKTEWCVHWYRGMVCNWGGRGASRPWAFVCCPHDGAKCGQLLPSPPLLQEDELLDELENEISSAVEDSLFDVSTPASSKHAQYDLPAVPTHRNTADLLPPVPQSSRHQQESDSEEDELSKLRNEMMLS